MTKASFFGDDAALAASVLRIRSLISSDAHRPCIGFALGDPADIGPEAIVKARESRHILHTSFITVVPAALAVRGLPPHSGWTSRRAEARHRMLYDACTIINVIDHRLVSVSKHKLHVRVVDSPREGSYRFENDTIECFSPVDVDMAQLPFGMVT